MITIETLSATVSGFDAEDLQRWIDNAWVRPDGPPGSYRFHDIDVARLRLILQLRDDMGIDEGALPVVLSLLDQLYETRRQIRRLCDVMETTLSPEDRRRLREDIGPV
ncbi:chaperone modulator CbpM [Acidisoma sp. 7E03]